MRKGLPTVRSRRDAVLAHYREMAAATDVPLNADFENGFAHDPDETAANVALCVATGVAGLSIEDYQRRQRKADLRLRSCGQTHKGGARGHRQGRRRRRLLPRRCENFLHGRPDLDDTIKRLKAFADAGADCLYAPGIKTREQIEAVVKAVAPKPVNFLNSGAFGFTVEDLAAMGVRRISVGGTLARVAMHAFIASAREIAQEGKFDSFAGVMPNAELNKFFSDDRKGRA